MNTIHNLGFIQKNDDILLDILPGKVYAKNVAIDLHVALLIQSRGPALIRTLSGMMSRAARRRSLYKG